jgi:hypothetical protein
VAIKTVVQQFFKQANTHWGFFFALLLILGSNFPFPNALAQTDSAVLEREDKIRAAYLFNLIKFLDWPETSFQHNNDVIEICIVASKHQANYLERLEARAVGGKPIRVTKLISFIEKNKILAPEAKQTKQTPQTQPAACHLAYFADGSNDKTLLSQLNQRHTVTVGIGGEFIDKGGLVAMIIKANHMTLNINHKKAKSKGIQMSANLLEVAAIVDK